MEFVLSMVVMKILSGVVDAIVVALLLVLASKRVTCKGGGSVMMGLCIGEPANFHVIY